MKYLLINSSQNVENFCVMSYNSRGFSQDKQSFCNFLLSSNFVGGKIPILCNQENFIMKGNFYKILQAFPNFHVIIKPAKKDSSDRGRARNGMFMAMPKYLKNLVTDVSPSNWRLQAVLLSSNCSKILIINSYFPVDDALSGDGELLEVLESIKHILEINVFDNVLLLGDINAEFVRNSSHCILVKQFLNEFNFMHSWSKFPVDFTHCQEVNGIPRYATLDHFFWNENLNTKVDYANVYHSLDNLSDHSVVYCVIKNEEVFDHKEDAKADDAKPKWKLADSADKIFFSQHLDAQLNLIDIPSSISNCCDMHCKDDLHRTDIDKFLGSILECIDSAAGYCLPWSRSANRKQERPKSKNKLRPGWSENVRPFRDDSIFWNQVWISAGKPLNCQLHNIMKHTRNVYHYQIRKIKKSEEIIKKNKLLEACINGEGEIFKEIKKIRSHKPQVATCIDGVTDNVSSHFKGIYEKLYNSIDDKQDMNDLFNEVSGRIQNGQLLEVLKVTPKIVKEAASRLSDSKNDPVFSFSSDCLKNGTNLLFEMLALAFKCLLIHGHFTLYLLLATFIPIIKDKLGSINESKNYRSIAISSLTMKLFDWVFLLLHGEKLGLDDLQFAYQAKCSTTMCTWSVIETIDYFTRKGSEVFSCCMDMSKAFDCLRHSVLFRKLLAANIPPIFLRLIMVIYLDQFANVKWNGTYSSNFYVSNGVRQGGVSSAILYCFYVNILFEKLRLSGFGCWINGNYHGIFGYSDDNLLLSPSLQGLQKMLNICEEFALEHNLKFSTDSNPGKCKTKCIAFGVKRAILPDLKLCGNSLPWVNQIKHLGTTISNGGRLTDQDVKIKRAQYINKNIELRQEFHFASSRTLMQVNEIYNFHFTGSPLWDLFGTQMKSLESSYNLSVKNMFGLPLATHRGLICTVTGKSHLRNILFLRFVNFVRNVQSSHKRVPRMFMNHVLEDVNSVTGSNMRNILLQTDKLNIVEVRKKEIMEIPYHQSNEMLKWRDQLVSELIDIREGALVLENLDNENIEELLNTLCTL